MTEPDTHASAVDKGSATNRLYRSLVSEPGASLRAGDVLSALRQAGLEEDDVRLRSTVANIRGLAADAPLTEAQLADLVAPDEASLVERALSGGLVVPDFLRFGCDLGEIFEECRADRGGEVASYIPQLARVDPEKFALGVCTVDGQRIAFGDSTESFCVQSACKPINYAVARDLLDRDAVHRHVGREPSGRSFNELTLNPRGLPHNPMVNAGAIMCASLIKPHEPLADRFDFVMRVWQDLAGDRPAAFNNAVYLSEKQTADRNFALAYFMRENGAFPVDTDLMATLDFYFQCCSITVDVRQMSVIAATLANGGVCPVTNKRVLTSEAVKDCLSLMYSCGMYDFSGEYAFSVGIPAKSGVSGALMLVVPGVCGIAIWSPRLDDCGNTVRGVRFSQALVRKYSFHSYANMVADPALLDPTTTEIVRNSNESSYLCAAAANGDLCELRRLIASGVDVSRKDYDGRTALHLAACEGKADVVRLLIGAGCELSPRDRWGNTPLDDAVREKRNAIVEMLGGKRATGRKAELELEPAEA
jgi:glutaminase